MFLKNIVIIGLIFGLMFIVVYVEGYGVMCGFEGQSICIFVFDFLVIYVVVDDVERNCVGQVVEFICNYMIEVCQIMNVVLMLNLVEYIFVIVVNLIFMQLMNDGLVCLLNDLVEKYGQNLL